MTISILGLGTASPRHQMTQEEAAQMFTDIVCEEERQSRLARALFRKAEVLTRNTVVPHKIAYNWCEDTAGREKARAPEDMAVPSEITPTVVPGQSLGPTTRERMVLYSRFAPDLAADASRRALEESGVAPPEITHLITITCTGFDAPGIDIDLIERLKLPNTTQRIQVGFMGCHGAINGMRTALAITKSNPTARVLLCAIELCSLHYRFTWDAEGIIANALFADGSAAIVLGDNLAAQRKRDGVDWQLLDTGSILIADSREAMSWRIGDHGFDMRLTSDVGDKIEAGLAEWLTSWLAQHQLQLADVNYWGVHPGGPRIVSAVQNSLRLSDEDLSTSRSILQRYGNMSSPTVLFILSEFRRIQSCQGAMPRRHCVLLGFGPGLVAEVALLSSG